MIAYFNYRLLLNHCFALTHAVKSAGLANHHEHAQGMKREEENRDHSKAQSSKQHS